ncbi:MAG: tetratricopeptide repeat protein [Candidatus Acidiferrales bacterium]
MTAFRTALALGALWLLAGAWCGLRAQTVSISKKRIPSQESPQDAALRQLLVTAQAALDKMDFETAAHDYSDYLTKKPDDAYAHFQLAYACTNLHRPEEAAAEYRKAIAIDPKMAPAYLNLGLTLVEKDPAGAVAPLQKAIELLPNDPRPRYVLGGVLERSGQTLQAIEQYRSALQLDPKDFDAHLALARALLHSQRPADAEPEFRAALNLRADSAAARSGLIESLLAQKKSEEAAKELDEYLKAYPNDAEARFEQASLLADAGKNEEALAELDHLAAAGAEPLGVLKLRAAIYLRLKNLDGASAALERAASLAPQDADVLAELGHVRLEKKDYPGAVRALGQALRIDAQLTDALKDLLAAQYLSGNYPAAIQLLDLLSKREKLSAGSWFIRATCYDKMDQKAEALDAYQKFLELNAGQTNDQYFEASARARALARELKDKKH